MALGGNYSFCISDKGYFISALFKTAELTKLVANRKATRSKVTRSFNERESFKDLTQCNVKLRNLICFTIKRV